jgi:hypothetical protein
MGQNSTSHVRHHRRPPGGAAGVEGVEGAEGEEGVERPLLSTLSSSAEFFSSVPPLLGSLVQPWRPGPDQGVGVGGGFSVGVGLLFPLVA